MSRSPSISAPANTDSMSSRGSTRLAAISFWKYSIQLAGGHQRVEFDLRVGGSGGRVRPGPELLPVVGRGADQLGDQPGGQRSGDLLGELVHRTRLDAVEDAADDLADLRLEHRNAAPGEAGVDQLAHLPVPGRVGEDQASRLHRARHAPGPGW